MADQMESELSDAIEAEIKQGAKGSPALAGVAARVHNQTLGQTLGQPPFVLGQPRGQAAQPTPAEIRTQQERIRELAEVHQRMADDIGKLEATADLIDKRIASLRARAV